MDTTASLNPALPFSHPPEHRDRLIQKLLQADAKVVTLRPVIDPKSRAIAESQREDFKSSFAQETARVKLLNNKLSRKDKGGGVNAQTALAEYRSKNVLATLTKAKPWLASSDDRALSLFNSSAGYRARAAETSDMTRIHTDDDVNRTGSPVVMPYDPPSPPPPDDRGRRVFQTGGPTPSYSSSHASSASSPQRPLSTSLSSSRPPSAASSTLLAASTLSRTASPSRPQSGFSASFSSSRPRTASSVVSSRAPFGGWAHVTTRPLSSKQGFISAEQSIGMEILQRRRCEVLGRSMWRLGKNERSVIAPKGKMEGGNSDFARELKRSQDSKERNLAMLEGLFRWMYLLDEKCNSAFEGSVSDTWEQLVNVAASHNDLVKLKCEKSKLHLADASEGKLGWKHPDPPSTVPSDDPCRYDYFLDWVVEDNRGRAALYTSLSNQWRDAVLGRKAICISPNDHLEWVARIVSWHFDSFPLLPTQELDHELTGRMVINMFDTFPAAPTKSKLVAMALYLDICGFGPFMPQEMRDALQQNIQSESSPLGSEAHSPTISSISATFSAAGSVDRGANEAANADSATTASMHLRMRADEVHEAKLDCKDEMGQLYRSAVSAIIKEEAVSKAIYGNVLQMHSWSKENEGTEVGVMLNKVMMTFVAATKAYKSTLVSGVSKLNKKLSLLKQQHQQLKIRVQTAREQAAKDEAARKASLIADASISSPTLSSPPLYAKRRGSMKSDAAMQEIDSMLGPAEMFSPVMLRHGSFAKFSLLERRDSSSSLPSPSEGRSRRISQYLRDSAGRVAMDSPEIFEIPGFEPRTPSPPPLDHEIRQRRRTMDLFKEFSSNVLEAEAGQLEALMDTYQSKQLEVTYSHVADDFKDDREHLSVMFRKAVIDARKQRSAHGQHPSAAFTSKISPEDVVTLMHELGESVKLAQVIAFMQPAGYNAAVGPCISFDDFFGWWCYYQKKVAEEESNGQHTSRSQ